MPLTNPYKVTLTLPKTQPEAVFLFSQSSFSGLAFIGSHYTELCSRTGYFYQKPQKKTTRGRQANKNKGGKPQRERGLPVLAVSSAVTLHKYIQSQWSTAGTGLE